MYSSDNPEESDFSNPAIIDFENMIQIAIFTGGRSPAMSKKIKDNQRNYSKKSLQKKILLKLKFKRSQENIAKETIDYTNSKEKNVYVQYHE